MYPGNPEKNGKHKKKKLKTLGLDQKVETGSNPKNSDIFGILVRF